MIFLQLKEKSSIKSFCISKSFYMLYIFLYNGSSFFIASKELKIELLDLDYCMVACLINLQASYFISSPLENHLTFPLYPLTTICCILIAPSPPLSFSNLFPNDGCLFNFVDGPTTLLHLSQNRPRLNSKNYMSLD